MGFQDQWSLNAGLKYCRMLQGEHSTILQPAFEVPHGFKTFVLPIFEWSLKTCFTVYETQDFSNIEFTVKLVLSGHTKLDKTKVLKTNGSFMKVESIAECSLRNKNIVLFINNKR